MTKESPTTEADKPSFYEELVAIDVIDPIMPLFVKGLITVDLRKPKPFSLTREDVGLNRMWTFSTVCPDRKCAKWLGVYFKFYHILPPPCKQCWKVVYVPQALDELIELSKFQARLGLPGKCGTEARDYTSGIGGYRAFWYCPYYKGLKAARAHFGRIKNALIKEFGEDFILRREAQDRLYLKRGCTELERDFGPSDKWDEIDHSRKFNLLETVWEDPFEPRIEFTPLRYTNYKRWIETAMAYGDLSVIQYIRSDKLGVQAVKYHNSTHKTEQFKNYIEPLNDTMEDGKDGRINETSERAREEEDLFELVSKRSKKD